MGFEAAIVLASLLLVLGLLIFTRIAPAAVMMGGLTLVMICPAPTESGWRIGVLKADQALAGFSNSGLFTVGVLFVVVCGLRTTGGVDWIAHTILGRPATLRRGLLRIIAPVAGMSAFLNNTPVVAMLIPAVADWARRARLPASKFMIPLSYAAILGGTCSLIGTSTNLVVSGLVTAQTDLPPIQIFDVAWIGVPCLLVGAAFLLIFGPTMLPHRGSFEQTLSDPREYTAEMIVPPNSPVVGQSVEQAGLRNLPGCYLVEIERGNDVLPAVGPSEILRADDRLIFAGVVESIRELQSLRSLAPATNQVFKLDSPRHRRRLFEAVVSESCPIAGKTIKEGRFRTMYEAAVLAVARNGERVRGRIGDIRLRPGDVLLLEAGTSFERHQRDSRDFLLIRTLEDSTPRRHDRAPVAMAILVAMVLVAALGWLSMLNAALVAAGLLLITRCCTTSDAQRSIDWSVLVVIGAGLGLGIAMDQSGAAKWIAERLLAVGGDHPWMALAAIYIATSMLTEVITNNAAVALVFPIALATSRQLGVSFEPFIYAIMMAGSASFATPIGYQTNLMVYGPGGYTFKDFLRVGLPMNLLMAITTIALVPRIWPF
ncbi:MAG: SLC13 family permease [Phycisphaerales bacterium]|nr:SLC13 family permease [Phycisphaerales bacterium]MCB9862544.1 SLC13 family permease [Phycisphaerales bacterium]